MTDNLYTRTRDLHHACERHPVGQRMSAGEVSAQDWADWLWAMQTIHRVVDHFVPAHMNRDLAFTADLSFLPEANLSKSAATFAAFLIGEPCGGTAYVLHGAHRSGGRVLAPKMAKRGLPTYHTCYKHPKETQDWVAAARERTEWVSSAVRAFSCLLRVLDEIEERQ